VCVRAANQPALRTLDANKGAPAPPIVPKGASPVVLEPPQVTSYRVPLFEAMKFTGPAPERINGRLAMLAFVFAVRQEALTGSPALEQLQQPSWLVAALMGAIVYATMVPVLRGVKEEDFFMFTVRAEKINGRAAMLGFAALLILEWQAGGSFF
jgi:hypothetical protein